MTLPTEPDGLRPVALAGRVGPAAHAVSPLQRVGGPKVAGALLVLLGPALAEHLQARARQQQLAVEQEAAGVPQQP